MCGIFAYAGTKTIGQKVVLKGLKALEYRGYDSWGLAVRLADGQWWILKQIGKISNFSGSSLPKSSFVFGHTRWATHGGVTRENAHPHQDCHSDITLIHNGIVENYHSLKAKLQSQGHVFISETDSEVIAHQIEAFRHTANLEKAVLKTFRLLEGQSAIIAADRQNDYFVAVKKGSPLVVGYAPNANFIASDPSALIPYTRQLYFLRDGEAAIVSRKGIVIKDSLTGHEKSIKPIKADAQVKTSVKGRFAHFMLKEIYEQPTVVQNIVDEPHRVNALVTDLNRYANISLVGCGSAYHAALMAKQCMADIAGRPVVAEIAGDAADALHLYPSSHLMIALSQSGETMDILTTVKLAKQKQVRLDSLVNVVGSALFRESDIVIPLNAGHERAVATTKAFMAKTALLLLSAYQVNRQGNEGVKHLKALKTGIQQLLKPALQRKIKTVAECLKDSVHAFIIGRGLASIANLEIALKLKEVAYIHAESYKGSEIKHGPIALIETGTPVLAFMGNDQYLADNLSTVAELKARGGYIIGISPQADECFAAHIPVPDCGYETALLNVVIGQLLAYYLAVARGLDPDMPRNLAKSVTVK
ncbi:glutamine--fructose-6-phosphate transaminase (isomerizing) [Microgenomates group bacterium RIFCSPLOWO2_01_FULL_47_10]|nr:MAG: glutamine--fructose-6-phosphate transaminase (isomerizing) [Microgenomates group bacterium RIFCSPLOWO2_01_FULL_47_10]